MVTKEAREIATRWPLTAEQVQTFINAHGDKAELFIRAAVQVGAKTYRELLELTGQA